MSGNAYPRWVPPFRLDMGGDDPGSVLPAEQHGAAPVRQSPPASKREWGVGRLLAVIVADSAGRAVVPERGAGMGIP